MSVTILRADARMLPLADESVDLIVSSPPYWSLRAYQDNGETYDGQIGAEATPGEFVDALIDCTREWMRVLKPSGSIFVNLGDKMRDKSLMLLPERYRIRAVDELGMIARAVIVWSKPNGLPESVTDRVRRSHEDWVHLTKQPRYYSAVDELRLPSDAPRGALRAAPSRPALGPELAATIRTEDGSSAVRGWCHLGSLKGSVGASVAGQAESFQVAELVGFSLRVEGAERDYVVDLESLNRAALDAPMAVAVEHALADVAPAYAPPRSITSRPSGVLVSGAIVGDALRRAEVLSLECAPIAQEGIAARITLRLDEGWATLLVWDAFAARHGVSLPHRSVNLGKLPSSVWTIPTEPLQVPDHLGIDHFAAFPTECPRRIITGWSPRGVCVECGEGRRPVTRVERDGDNRARRASDRGFLGAAQGENRNAGTFTITGYACACPDTSAPTTPGVVLDPFGGTGTTALVADVLGRHGVSVDLSADYCRLARWRTTDPKQRAKAARVEAVEPVSDDQPDLFEEPAS